MTIGSYSGKMTKPTPRRYFERQIELIRLLHSFGLKEQDVYRIVHLVAIARKELIVRS